MSRLRLFLGLLFASLFLTTPAIYVPSLPVLAAQSQNEKNEVKVWVNTNSGVYHCPGTRWYGSTKQGKYESECAAIKDGNRPAYGKACGSECQSGLTNGPSSAPRTEESTAPTTPREAGNPDTRVWVNTNSGVYHCPGTRWYGNTKHGEFMTQKKAQGSGYRPAYSKVCQ
jgi:hypothetical protein